MDSKTKSLINTKVVRVNDIPFIAKWKPLLKKEGPYNVGLEDYDCGAIYLGPDKTVEAAVFVGPGAPLKRVLIPDAVHTCVDHTSPQQRDCLYLGSYGDAFGTDFREYVGVYDATDPENPGRFFFKLIPKKWGQGDYVAKDDG